MSVSGSILASHVKATQSMGAAVTYWDRSSSYGLKKNVQTCDAFILVLPGNALNYLMSELPIGCRRELAEARSCSREIYIAYTANGKSSFYKASIFGNKIKGLIETFYKLASAVVIFKLEQNKSDTSIDLEIPNISSEDVIRLKKDYSAPLTVNPCGEQVILSGSIKLTYSQAVSSFIEALEHKRFDRRLLL